MLVKHRGSQTRPSTKSDKSSEPCNVPGTDPVGGGWRDSGNVSSICRGAVWPLTPSAASMGGAYPSPWCEAGEVRGVYANCLLDARYRQHFIGTINQTINVKSLV